MDSENSSELLTFGGHLEVLRRMLFRILGVAGVIAAVVLQGPHVATLVGTERKQLRHLPMDRTGGTGNGL